MQIRSNVKNDLTFLTFIDYCMVQFVKPNLLGKYKEYLNRFVNPITNGQYVDSTPADILMMKRRSHILHKMLDGCVQRRDYAVLAPYLPVKHEYVVYIKLTKLQVELYNVCYEQTRVHKIFIFKNFILVLHRTQTQRRTRTYTTHIPALFGLSKPAAHLDTSACTTIQQR